MRFSLSYRFVLLFLLLALLVSLIPLLSLAPYDFPCADDFSFGADVHTAWESTHSFFAVLQAARTVALSFYENWQGSFCAVFLMALHPAVFGESCYALTPFLMLAMFLGGTFCFCLSLFSRVFALPRSFGACAAALLSLFSLQLIPYPVQSLYWFNGSLYYTFFYGLSLLAFSLAIPAAQQGGLRRILPLCVLCFLLGGSNYVTALNVCLLFFTMLLVSLFLRHPAWKRLLVPFLFLLLSFTLNIAAPGNDVRQRAMTHTPNALLAIGQSFVAAGRSCLSWFSLPVAGMLFLLGLLFWNTDFRRSGSFRLPWLVTLYSFCVYAALFTPPLYAQGGTGDGRLLDIIFYAFLLLLTLNLFYWIGWLQRRISRVAPPNRFPLAPLLLTLLGCLICCAIFISNGHGFTSLMAVGHLRSGDAAAYRDASESRLLLLRDESVEDVVLDPYPVTPYLLYFDDISDDADDWRNQALCAFYGKKSAILNAAEAP